MTNLDSYTLWQNYYSDRTRLITKVFLQFGLFTTVKTKDLNREAFKKSLRSVEFLIFADLKKIRPSPKDV
jgi:hypothetical protein